MDLSCFFFSSADISSTWKFDSGGCRTSMVQPLCSLTGCDEEAEGGKIIQCWWSSTDDLIPFPHLATWILQLLDLTFLELEMAARAGGSREGLSRLLDPSITSLPHPPNCCSLGLQVQPRYCFWFRKIYML